MKAIEKRIENLECIKSGNDGLDKYGVDWHHPPLSKEEEETILKANYILSRAGQCEPMIEVGGDGTVQVKGSDEERQILEDSVRIVTERMKPAFRRGANKK